MHDTRKTGLIIDLGNLFYAARIKYGFGRRVSLVKYLESFNCEFLHKVVYTKQPEHEIRAFAAALREHQWEVHCGGGSWSVAIALRAANMAPQIDHFILGTNFTEGFRVLQWMKNQGKSTTCCAIDIPLTFKAYADCIEIHEDLLENHKTTKSMDVSTNVAGDPSGQKS